MARTHATAPPARTHATAPPARTYATGILARTHATGIPARKHATGIRARSRIAIVSAMVTALAIGNAAGVLAATADEVAAAIVGGLYTEPGAEPIDGERWDEIRTTAADGDMQLSVVVLAAPVSDAVAFAEAVNALVPGTIMVFTPDAYGVASTDLTQDELDEALGEAADELASSDVADGAEAFVDAARPSTTPWGAIIAIGLLVVVIVAVVGRAVERRATAERRRSALRREWSRLEARADVMAGPVLDLSTSVDLDGRAELADRYRAAASQYGELRNSLDRPPASEAVSGIEDGLDELERRLDALESDVAESRRPSDP